jgi:hypothetical protein
LDILPNAVLSLFYKFLYISLGDFSCVYMLYTSFPPLYTNVYNCVHSSRAEHGSAIISEGKSRIGCEFGLFRGHLLEVHLPIFKGGIIRANEHKPFADGFCIRQERSFNKDTQVYTCDLIILRYIYILLNQ